MQKCDIIVCGHNEYQVSLAELRDLPSCMAHSDDPNTHFKKSKVLWRIGSHKGKSLVQPFQGQWVDGSLLRVFMGMQRSGVLSSS